MIFHADKLVILLYFVFIIIGLTIDSASADVEWGGYYKNLLVNSKTVFPAPENYNLDLNRLRLKLRGEITETLGFNIEYDNELLLGDYIDTQQFSTQKRQTSTGYIDLEDEYLDQSDIYARHLLYRAYISYTMNDISLRLGRQRIAWGTALLWNPMDILNPLNPIQLEREERPGVDALLMDWDYNALSRLSLVAARHDEGEESSYAVRWRSHLGQFDFALMSGQFRNDDVTGFDFAGQIEQIGIRGEFTRNSTITYGVYNRLVVGADYTFANTLSISIEYYFNGQGARDKDDYDITRWLSGDLQGLARHYIGTFIGYDLTPIFRWDNYIIINLDDNSSFVFPGLDYSLSDNLDLSVGVQLYNGSEDSEYGQLQNIYYTQLQWFF